MTAARNPRIMGTIRLLVVVCLWSISAQAQYGGGSGTADDPYQIWTAEQMNAIGAEPNDWDKHFKLMGDIDLAGYVGTDFNIIGYYRTWQDRKPFTGVFDGNGKRISNFSYTSTDRDYVGLFGYVNGRNAEIKDLRLIDANIDAGTGGHVGSVVGQLENGTITRCYVAGGSVSGGVYVGGLVGRVHGGTITNCRSTSGVTGYRYVGGLSGENYAGTVTSCYCSRGSITGDVGIGGLVGANRMSGEILNCYATGDVTGNGDVGGLVGSNSRREAWVSKIRSCYSVGRVTGNTYAGGLVGSNSGVVEFSFWDIQTSGQATSASGTSKATAEMKQRSTFAGWDFVEVWDIAEDQTYPFLRFSAAGDLNRDQRVDFTDLAIFAENWLVE